MVISTELKDIIKNPKTTLIDLRNQDELDEVGFLPQAQHIPMPELANHLQEIQAMSGAVVLFCRSGGRAGRAKTFLEEQGVEQVYNAGGYHDVAQVLEEK